MGKKTKRPSSGGRDKSFAPETNPFEVRFHRNKHDVLGRKVKLQTRPLQSRARAIEKRKNTLLVEYKRRHKNNVFLDKRFGEGDESLSVEEKMLQRFALSKQKYHARSGTYNLEDDQLTHLGQSLADVETLTDHRPFMDSSDEDDMNSRMQSAREVKQHHFGGFLTKKMPGEGGDGVPERRLTQKEIMDAKVAKSKMEKAHRHMEREHLNRQLNDVDALWKEIQHRGVPQADKEEAKVDDYDILARQLQFESRQAQAKNRLPTEEEKAKAESERLEKLENERLQRMQPPELPVELYESADYLGAGSATKKGPAFMVHYDDGKMIQPEDAENFVWQSGFRKADEMSESDTPSEGTSDGADDGEEINEGNDDEEDEEEDEDEDEEESAMSDEDMQAAKFGSDLEDDQLTGDPSVKEDDVREGKEKKSPLRKMKSTAMSDTPFMLDVPSEPKSLDEFFSLVTNSRMSDIAHCKPVQTCRCMQERLQEARDVFNEERKGHHHVCLPLSTLMQFQQISTIFTTSDYKHCVVTPAMVFMAEAIVQWPVNNAKQVLSGLCICKLVWKYVRLSKRFMPEVINFLTGVLSLASTSPLRSCHYLVPPFSTATNPHLLVASRKHSSMPKPRQMQKIFSSEPPADNDGDRLWAVHTCLMLLEQFVPLYSHLPSHHELFAPARLHIHRMSVDNWPPHLQELHGHVSELLSQPPQPKRLLQLLKKKPVPLKLYEPKFDESYRIGKKSSRNKEEHETAKVKHKLKREMKGAVREIRKDNAFLMRQRLKEQLARDKERVRKVNRLRHLLAEERHEQKKIRRKK